MKKIKVVESNPRLPNESKREWSKRLNKIDNRFSSEGYRNVLKCIEIDSLVVSKVTTHANGGETIVETRDSESVSTEGLQVERVTTSPQGGQWVKYKAEDVNYRELFEEIANDLGKVKLPKRKKVEGGQKCAVVNLYDAHLDKLAVQSLHGESGTLQDNIDIYLYGLRRCLDYCKENKVGKIIFPIGNDLFHTNGMNSTTKSGTPIQYLCHPLEAYKAISNTMIEAVRMCLDVADVHVPYIPGNHDRDKVSVLGFWMDMLFENRGGYTSDSNVLQRTYYRHGVNLFGFAHGDKEKRKIAEMPLIMHQERAMDSAECTQKKFYLGDLHHRFEHNFLRSKDFIGTTVEFLRSVGLSDEYHAENGWIGIPKTAYVDIYNYDNPDTKRGTFNL